MSLFIITGYLFYDCPTHGEFSVPLTHGHTEHRLFTTCPWAEYDGWGRAKEQSHCLRKSKFLRYEESPTRAQMEEQARMNAIVRRVQEDPELQRLQAEALEAERYLFE